VAMVGWGGRKERGAATDVASRSLASLKRCLGRHFSLQLRDAMLTRVSALCSLHYLQRLDLLSVFRLTCPGWRTTNSKPLIRLAFAVQKHLFAVARLHMQPV